jgi:hypothetical protein
VALQAVALDLSMTPVGAFDDQRVKSVVDLADREEPLYLLPLGRVWPRMARSAMPKMNSLMDQYYSLILEKTSLFSTLGKWLLTH